MYDVIVVGARCAGAPTAMQLARKGHRVLLVDRSTFPSDTISTHFIQLPGMVRLKRWGLLDKLLATDCPPVTEGLLSIDGDAALAEFPMPEGIPGLMAPRRTVLDKILVDAAVDAGAELAEGVSVDNLLFEGGRVVGIQAHTSENPSITEKARVVVGADGRNSVVARAVEAADVTRCEPLGAGFYTYFANLECPRAELYLHSNHFSVAFPTNDGLTLVAAGQPVDAYAEWKRDIEGHFIEHCDQLGDLGSRVRAATRAEKFVGAAVPNFVRRSWGPGWALVGDAGYQKDPTPADGITDAFRAADTLSNALDDVLSGPLSEDERGERFQQEIEEYALPLYEHTIKMSSFDVEPVERMNAFFEIANMHQKEIAHIPPAEVAA